MFRIKGKGPVYRLSRRNKALMIEAVVANALEGPVAGKRILDIGCGNGDISQHFAGRNDQYGVDVEDRRRPENDGLVFSRVSSERLPFDDGFFDVVLSHHVIEHVADQALHLREMHRVLVPNGLVYLATPNRTSPLMQGHVGNDAVLPYRQMRPLFERAGFEVTEYSSRVVCRPDDFHGEVRLLRWAPYRLVHLLRDFFPSQAFVLTRR